MIRLVALQGFQAHLDSALELSPGVNVVVGPTDSGKSSIVRGVGWLVFNRPTGEAFVNAKAKACTVMVSTDRGVALRSRKPKNEYRIDGNVLSAVGRSVPPELAGVLNLDEINVQWQLQPYFLVLESAGTVSRYITEQLDLDTVDRAIKTVNQEAQSLSTKLAILSEDAGIAITRLKQLEGLDANVELLDSVLSMHQQAVTLQADIAELSFLLDTMRDVERELQQIDEFYQSIRASLVDADHLRMAAELDLFSYDELKQLVVALVRNTEAFAALDKHYDSVVASLDPVKAEYVKVLASAPHCPTCFGVVDEDRVLENL